MKNLLFITPHLGGGAGKAISGLIQNITGFKCTVVMLEKPQYEKYVEECKYSGAEIIITSAKNQIFDLAEKSDVVIYNWWAHPLSVDLIRELGKAEVRLVIWSHINGLQYPALTADFLDIFDSVMFTSPCSLNNPGFSDEQKDRISTKCSYIYGFGDFHPDKIKYKNNYKIKKNLKIGYLGTMDFAKLNPEFPKICYEIRQYIPDVEYILCGGYSQEFKAAYFADYPELQQCTSFLGFVNDPDEKMQLFDIFCYPLTKDNYATTENALLEAMAAGLPVVVLSNPAEKEIVENEVNGICTDEISSFISETVALSKDETKRQNLGIAARNTIINKYNVEINTKTFIQEIDKVLGIKKHRRDFKACIGNDIWENFLYFSGADRDKIINILQGEKSTLPNIYYSESKSSPRHYSKYFYCRQIDQLSKYNDDNLK